ncbi:MAG: arginine deiminase [Saprospiraceae bacterium]|jgi:arginine deiminase|nr:arginine deiminase [Saprospiraceae bacterium]
MINVNSEIGLLKKVIIHRPDDGIARISPKKAEELLFDDIVHLPKMKEEHDIFRKVLQLLIGKQNVLDTESLIIEGFEASPEIKEELIDKIIDYEELPITTKSFFMGLPPDELTGLLITGYHQDEDYIYFDPIPNFIFTRDIAIAIKDHIIISKAAKSARYRENLLTRFIFYAHPLFKALNDQDKIINLNHLDKFPPSRKGEVVSLEGGDVMMLNDDFILIGCSERTTDYAIRSLKEVLFSKGLVNNIAQINIPADRTCMHIDTLFTMIDYNDIVCYKPTVYDGVSSNVKVFRKNGAEIVYDSVKTFFFHEINPKINFIFSGGGVSPYQEREQWTDGCNMVAIKPGVALTYDRNPKTEEALTDAGYVIMHAKEFIDKTARGDINPETIQKTIITLPSNELSRARGGSHCMTCPIIRESI